MSCTLPRLCSALLLWLLAALAVSQSDAPAGSAGDINDASMINNTDTQTCRQAVAAFPIRPVICAEVLAELRLRRDTPSSALAEVTSLLAVGYARTDRAVEATAIFDRLLTEQPNSWIANANHAAMLLYLGQFESALRATNRAIVLSPQPIPDLHLNQALAYRGLGDFSAAKQANAAYQSLMGLRPADPPTDPQILKVFGPPEADNLDERFDGSAFKPTRGVQTR